jgi:hypothetical protein
MSIIREMRQAGLSKSDMVWEVLGGLSVVIFPVIVLFIAYIVG